MPPSHEQIQIAWFRAFLAVHRTGSFTAAAAEVHRSQSRVSALVAQLERHLGTDLFVRGNVPIQLTDQGRELLPYAQSIVDRIEEAAAAVSVRTGIVRGRVSVRGYPGVTAFLLAPVIRHFQDKFPEAKVTLWEDDVTAPSSISQGLVDFAVNPTGPVNRPGIVSTPLFHEPIVCLVPADHPAAARTWVEPDFFVHETIIMIGDVAKDHSTTDDLLASSGVHPERRHVVGYQPTTVSALVSAGLGVGVLPMLAAKLLNTRGAVRLLRVRAPAFGRDVAVLSRRDRHYPPVAQEFLKAMLTASLPEGVERVRR